MIEAADPRQFVQDRETPKITPFSITERDKLIIFGVLHTVQFHNFPQQTTDLRRRISSCDHLLMEGNRESNRLGAGSDKDYFEALAIRWFKKVRQDRKGKSIHYLEEQTPNVQDWQTHYVIDFNSFVALSSFEGMVRFVADRQTTREQFLNSLDNSFGYLSRVNPYLKLTTASEIIKLVMRLHDYRASSENQTDAVRHGRLLSDSIRTHEWYKSRLRDYEIILPTFEQLLSQLSGNKAVLIGQGHVRLMEARVDGVEIAPPRPWPDFVSALPKRYQEGVCLTQKLLTQNS